MDLRRMHESLHLVCQLVQTNRTIELEMLQLILTQMEQDAATETDILESTRKIMIFARLFNMGLDAENMKTRTLLEINRVSCLLWMRTESEVEERTPSALPDSGVGFTSALVPRRQNDLAAA